MTLNVNDLSSLIRTSQAEWTKNVSVVSKKIQFQRLAPHIERRGKLFQAHGIEEANRHCHLNAWQNRLPAKTLQNSQRRVTSF